MPIVIDNWIDLNVEEQQSISTLNNFFCSLHLLIGMADTASTLLQWERSHFEGSVGAATLFGGVKKSESGIKRLVRTACKALCKHGREQSGMYQRFTVFLKSKGMKKNLLVSFWGNCIFIMLGSYITYISECLKNFQ